MSHFICEKCGKAIMEGSGGHYITECEHYPLDREHQIKNREAKMETQNTQDAQGALYEFYIAGVQHHQLNTCIKELSVGQELDLVPDPENRFDPNAVAIVYSPGGEHVDVMLGFVPKAKGAFSDKVSAALEHRKLVCKIIELNPEAKTWEQLKVAIYDLGEKE